MFPTARSFLFALPVAGLALTFACSGSSNRAGFDTTGADASTSGPSAPTGGFNSDPDSGPKVGADGCSEEAKLVYVLSLEGDIYSFAPADKKFTKIGPLNCKSGGTTFMPISMAVDRNAVAWVNMRDDGLFSLGQDTMFKVDTKTGACTPTAIKGMWGGMGFSTNEGTTDQETLFAIGSVGTATKAGLLKVDFAQEKFVQIADLKEPVDMELTGTGDGRLYGFLISNPLALAAVNKATTAFTDRVSLAQVETPAAPMFAFSFWGGDFYFYTATDKSAAKTTNVTRFRPSDGSVDTSYMKGIGFHIVGAGVSTCAPTTLPR